MREGGRGGGRGDVRRQGRRCARMTQLPMVTGSRVEDGECEIGRGRGAGGHRGLGSGWHRVLRLRMGAHGICFTGAAWGRERPGRICLKGWMRRG